MATSGQTRQRRREVHPFEKLRTTNPDCLNLESRSLVEIGGPHRSKCGYCKAESKTSVSYGLFAKRLTCSDYQELIDRGWRRSGTYIYKPVMHETCCPQYTIRLDVSRFKPNKGQRQLHNRLRRYLDGDHTATSGESGRRKSKAQGAPRMASAAAATDDRGNGRKHTKSGGSHKGKGETRGGRNHPHVGCSASSGDQREDSRILEELSTRVTAAAIAAVEAGIACGTEIMPEWRSEVEAWSRVRPIRNKKHCRVSGEGVGFCSTVALNIASAARKQGWRGTGGAGGALAIAEAIAARMKGGSAAGCRDSGALVSDVTVAPNGFINFAVADLRSSSEATQPTHPQPPPSESRSHSPSHSARATGESPTPPPTPPPPLGLSNTLPDGGQPSHGGSARNDRADLEESSVPSPAVVKEPPGSTAGADGSRRVARDSPGVEIMVDEASSARFAAEERVEFPVDRGGALAVMEVGGSVEAAAASMEWSERQGRNVDEMDIEAPSFSGGASSPGAAVSGPSTGLSSLPPLDPGLVPHRMTVTTVPSRLTDEVFSLYVKYQVSVHGDDPLDVTRVSFRRFLVDSPLLRESLGGVVEGAQNATRLAWDDRSFRKGEDTEGESARETEGRHSLAVPYGSYHQLYRIDDRLVAVGVVDILPKCLSSVYCFYDPDYRALALGKLTALMETDFVREASSLRPALRHYYMGFYIHTCPKMSYKGSYSPSYLLCPEKLFWVPLELCRPVLDRRKYARLSDLLDPSPAPADAGGGDPRGTVSRDQMSERGVSESTRGVSASSSRYDTKDDSRQHQGEPTQERQGEDTPSSRRPSPGASSAQRATGQGRRRGRAGRKGAFQLDDDHSTNRAEAGQDEVSEMNKVPLLLGRPPFPVSMAVLAPQAKAIVTDVLRTYVAAMGPVLAKRVLLKLYG